MRMLSGVLRCGVVAMALLLTGCGGTASIENGQGTQASTDNALFTVRQSGGCVQIGPNCAVHTLFANGQVHAVRRQSDEVTPEVTASLDRALVDNFQSTVANANFNALLEQLAAGTCAGCVDGIDYEYSVYQANNVVTISSVDYEFDTSIAFFAVADDIYRAMLDAAPLEITNY